MFLLSATRLYSPDSVCVCGKMLPVMIASCARDSRTRVPTRAEGQVLIQRPRDKPGQGRILEYGPPLPVMHMPALDPGILRLDPLVGDGSRRSAVIRADLEAVADIVHRAGRDTAGCKQDRAHQNGPHRSAYQALTAPPRGVLPKFAWPAHDRSVQTSKIGNARIVVVIGKVSAQA